MHTTGVRAGDVDVRGASEPEVSTVNCIPRGDGESAVQAVVGGTVRRLLPDLFRAAAGDDALGDLGVRVRRDVTDVEKLIAIAFAPEDKRLEGLQGLSTSFLLSVLSGAGGKLDVNPAMLLFIAQAYPENVHVLLAVARHKNCSHALHTELYNSGRGHVQVREVVARYTKYRRLMEDVILPNEKEESVLAALRANPSAMRFGVV